MDRSEGSTPERLSVLEATDDGFQIAEEDLRLRGGGEALGTRQAGQAMFRLGLRGEDEAAASRAATRQNALIAMAALDAEVLLTIDPRLASPRGEAARLLLALFDKDAAEALLAAG